MRLGELERGRHRQRLIDEMAVGSDEVHVDADLDQSAQRKQRLDCSDAATADDHLLRAPRSRHTQRATAARAPRQPRKAALASGLTT